MANKRIILIHGLDSKPPKEDLFKFWKQCLKKNLELHDNYIIDDSILSMSYWANEIPNHLEDKNVDVVTTQQKIDEMLALRVQYGNNLHNNLSEIIGGFFKDKIVDLASMLTGALTLKDEILEGNLQEIKFYQNDQYIADKIRNQLEKEIIKAWDNDEEIAIISHSMGTFIAYDVLWRFSRKNVDKYKPYHNKKISLLMTMGSPLGETAVQNLLFGNHYKDDRKFPSNVECWYNFSALGDIVSHDSTLGDDFQNEMKGNSLLETCKDYINLQNIYRGSNDKINPHKSYGYLVQPKLAEKLLEFLNG